MIEHILVPLDGSPQSETVIPYVRRLVRLGAAKVTLLHTEAPPAVSEFGTADVADLDRAEAYLREAKARLEDTGVECAMHLCTGLPAETILERSREWGVTLIALATHRRRGLERFLLGSVTETVARRSPVPVLIIPPTWSYDLIPDLPPEFRPVREILVPLDGEDASLSILPFAVEAAQKLESRLTLLRVIAPPSLRFEGGSIAEAKHHLAMACDRCERDGVPAAARLESGDAASTILRVCGENRSDWIAMATHGRGTLHRWLAGSVTEKVLREAHVPMLVARVHAPGSRQLRPAMSIGGKLG